jgi:hypothetical protein
MSTRLTKGKMVSAIQDMMQGLGIPSVEFADENGNVKGRIDVPKPKDVACKVPAYGGGMVSIKQGDHIRLWLRDEYTGIWKPEGENGREAVGKVMCVRKDKFMAGRWSLAYLGDNRDKTDGPSSCIVQNFPSGWARVVEKLNGK